MSVCTFFGHSNTSNDIEQVLVSIIIDLIINESVNEFYVGNNGNFDSIVLETLMKLKKNYSHINYNMVLAYLPKSDVDKQCCIKYNSIYPEGLECVPPRFAINHRNKWMIDKSDYVITYVNHDFGGAAKFKRLAENKNKVVINIPDISKGAVKKAKIV